MKIFNKHITILFVSLIFVSCNIDNLLNKVEVTYEVDYMPNNNTPATLNYYTPDGEVKTTSIEAGSWSYNGIFDDGQNTGVWLNSDAQSGTVSLYLVVWYSELNDKEDYVDAWTWTFPQEQNVGLYTVIDRLQCFMVRYSVHVEGTNGIPVNIQYTDKDYQNGNLTKEETLLDGNWQYSECFRSGSYASLNATSEATSGKATINITIDYDDKTDVNESIVIDFSTNTKTGALGFEVD